MKIFRTACALAGYEGEDMPKVSRFAAALGQSQESSIIGGGRLSLTGATALNGFLITSVSRCAFRSDGGAPADAATEGLGERWELEQIALRPWPTSAANQALVSALFELILRNCNRCAR